MAGCVTDVTYKRARHPNENHQNACSFFGLLLIPYSLLFTLYPLPYTLYSLFFIPYSSLFLLIPPYSSSLSSLFLLISPSSSFLLSVKPPYNSDMKRVSCSENVNFVR